MNSNGSIGSFCYTESIALQNDAIEMHESIVCVTIIQAGQVYMCKDVA